MKNKSPPEESGGQATFHSFCEGAPGALGAYDVQVRVGPDRARVRSHGLFSFYNALPVAAGRRTIKGKAKALIGVTRLGQWRCPQKMAPSVSSHALKIDSDPPACTGQGSTKYPAGVALARA
jgi:hypothetical protein